MMIRAISRPARATIRDVSRSSRNVERVAMDAGQRQVILHRTKRRLRTAKSCGPGAATLASIRPACAGPATGARKAVPRGEYEVSRKATRAGKAGMSWLYLSNPCALFVALFAHGNAGAVGARLSLRPHSRRGPMIGKAQVKIAP